MLQIIARRIVSLTCRRRRVR